MRVEDNSATVLGIIINHAHWCKEQLEKLPPNSLIEQLYHTSAPVLFGGEQQLVKKAPCPNADPKCLSLNESLAEVNPMGVINVWHMANDPKKRGMGVLVTIIKCMKHWRLDHA